MVKNYFVLLTGLLLCLSCLVAGCSSSDNNTSPVISPTTAETIVLSTSTSASTTPEIDRYYEQRINMVETTIERRGVNDEDVLRAMRTVARHRFVTDEWLADAYADHPLPIGYGQTISQPYIVAWMTELLELEDGDRVLEIGTGSGYQAAVLAELGEIEVYSIEIVPELAQRAKQTLQDAGYGEVHLRQGDGYYGWEEAAPFDAIIVTAAPDHLPQPLVAQLAEGGHLVIPIGPPGGYQTLWQFELQPEKEIVATNMGGVVFVPFTGSGVSESQQP